MGRKGDERVAISIPRAARRSASALEAGWESRLVFPSALVRTASNSLSTVSFAELVKRKICSGPPTRCTRNAGGWPVLAMNRITHVLPANPSALSSDGSGYTNLEKWLQQKAAEVEGHASLPPIPVALAAPKNVSVK